MPKPPTSWARAWLKPSSPHLEDVAGPALAQVWNGGLRHPERAEQVRLDLIASIALGELLDRAEVTVAGVVDDDVELTEVIVGLLDRVERGRAVGDVEG